jgi:hypothetical protein
MSEDRVGLVMIVTAAPTSFVHYRDQTAGPGLVSTHQTSARQHGAGDKVTQARCPAQNRARPCARALRC